MVTGRVDEREEVERTSCSDAGREAVGDAHGRLSLPPLHAAKRHLVFPANPSSASWRRLVDLLLSRLSARSQAVAPLQSLHTHNSIRTCLYHCLADSCVAMETLHPLRKSCSQTVSALRASLTISLPA